MTGTVVKHHHREFLWPRNPVVPYVIKLEHGTIGFASLDCDTCVRAAMLAPDQCVHPSDGPCLSKSTEPRFSEGPRIECFVNRKWLVGTVVMQHYREIAWPPSKRFAYVVRLDSGLSVCAPMDRTKSELFALPQRRPLQEGQ